MKHFKLKLTSIFILIFFNIVALGYVLGKSDFLFTQLVLGSIFFILMLTVFYYIDSTNKAISKFLFALKYQDYSIRFPEKKLGSFSNLYRALNQSLKKLREIKEIDSESLGWMSELLQKIPLGILVLKQNDSILFMNPAVCSLLEIPHQNSLQAIKKINKSIGDKIENCPLGINQYQTPHTHEELVFNKLNFKKQSELTIIFIQSIQEIKGQIELEAWNNLFRVMTHEIMNSITSISSLASSLQESMTSENLPSDMLMAVNSIEKRSNNLIEFTESYRAINDIKLAQKSWFNLADLVKAQLEFLSIELKSIQLSLICAIDQQIYADKNQVEQVIINLILNSIAALRGVVNPSINIHIKSENKYVLLSWIDNGCGIPASIQNDIFIPFFSSKKDGKGIGLSLCRKLMRNNEGSISLLKSLNAHTEFSLRFKV